MKDALFERFVDAIEKIADNGIVIYPKNDGSMGSEKMAMDLASMKINDGLESIASALDSIARKQEE